MRLGLPHTIHAKVALATFLVLAGVLLLTGLVVDREVRRNALASLDDRLATEAEALASLVQFDGRSVGMEFEDEAITAYIGRGNGAYYQVSTRDGLVERSLSLDQKRLPPPTAAEFDADLAPGQPRSMRRTIPGPFEPEVRLLTVLISLAAGEEEGSAPAPAPPTGMPAPRRTVAVQLARTMASVDLAQGEARAALAVALPVALALATLGAFIVAQRATRPIQRMSRELGGISAGDLGARVDLSRTEGELRTLGVTLNGAIDRLAEAAARERRFSADVAHELRTPLAVLRSGTELILARERSGDEYREALERARQAGLRMQRLVDEMLLLARCESGGLPDAPLDLADVVRRALDSLKAAGVLEDGRVRLDGGQAAVMVRGSPPLLQRVVESLIENSLRHGGADAPIEVQLRAEGRAAGLTVRDRGPGFPSELLPRLFERFSRGDVSRSRESGGSGLGLAIVLAIVRAHGGEVSAGQREGGGAAVVVTLPLDGASSGSPRS